MSRIDDLIETLKQATDDVRKVLAEPKCIDELWNELSQGEGCRGENPHELALSDLKDDGEVVWWRDKKLVIWYGLKGSEPEGGIGDDSPAIREVRTFLETVGNLVGRTRYTPEGKVTEPVDNTIWELPHFNVLEIDNWSEATILVHIDGERIKIDSWNQLHWEAKWPGPTAEQVANELRKILKIS